MNRLNKFIVVIGCAFSLNAMAALNIESITLVDNSQVQLSNIAKVYLLQDQTVDYLDLKDGSRIEGSDVKNISLSKKFESRIQTMGAVRTGGDGSGG